MHIITIPRTNLYGWDDSSIKEIGNNTHYKVLKSWCQRLLSDNSWSSYITPTGGKCFIFSNESHVTLFLLKWSQYVNSVETR